MMDSAIAWQILYWILFAWGIFIAVLLASMVIVGKREDRHIEAVVAAIEAERSRGGRRVPK